MNKVRALVVAFALAVTPVVIGAAPAQARSATVTAGEIPPGYTLVGGYFLGRSWCHNEGRAGVANGSWTDYICEDKLVGLPGGMYLLHTSLWVKR
ncbi:hypothetical protein HNP84_009043 [Thermocatellispora tengchongensis]|uniref:Uncharacterized protein n=1 Tax=Thermocatellispora tengchongensis TaxID=1073253 RepID=A0A840PNK3_9ACTN|nr:hypothetical protein [Thermocatellispora tengchongensis]MBB5139280.1 hypothetical protein [Thermocatellispora tengchongensis]